MKKTRFNLWSKIKVFLLFSLLGFNNSYAEGDLLGDFYGAISVIAYCDGYSHKQSVTKSFRLTLNTFPSWPRLKGSLFAGGVTFTVYGVAVSRGKKGGAFVVMGDDEDSEAVSLSGKYKLSKQGYMSNIKGKYDGFHVTGGCVGGGRFKGNSY